MRIENNKVVPKVVPKELFKYHYSSPKEPIKSRMTKMLSIHSSEDTTLEKTSSGHQI